MFIHTYINYSPGFPMCFPQEQGILYTQEKLSEGLWSLGFLKICPIFLEGLKTIWMLYLFSILSIWSVVSFIYGRIEKVLFLVSSCDGCVLGFIALLVFADYFIYIFFIVRSLVRLVSDDSVCKCTFCQRWWKLYIQVTW